jgi:hypothetical protein
MIDVSRQEWSAVASLPGNAGAPVTRVIAISVLIITRAPTRCNHPGRGFRAFVLRSMICLAQRRRFLAIRPKSFSIKELCEWMTNHKPFPAARLPAVLLSLRERFSLSLQREEYTEAPNLFHDRY